MADQRNPWPRLPKWPPDAGHNLRKASHHVSRDKKLHVSWSSAALPGVSLILHFEPGEGPGDEVGQQQPFGFQI